MTLSNSLVARLKALPSFAGFLAIGCGLFWLALSGLLPVFRAIEARAPMVALAPRDALGLPLAVAFFALAAMTLFPTPAIGPERRQRNRGKHPGRRFDGPALCLAVAVAAAVCSVVASPVTQIFVQMTVSARGYLPCAPVPGERPAYKRWIHAGPDQARGRCPSKEERPS